jgi:hypothetical protein
MAAPRHLFSLAAFVVASLATPSVEAEELEVSIAYVPVQGAEVVEVEQPIGRLTVRGWDRAEVKIVARKRAPDGATLDRLKVNVEMVNGRVTIRSGLRTEAGFRVLPLGGAAGRFAVDLSIDAPAGAYLRARTWRGDLDAAGFRAGAHLSSAGGEVTARDIDGAVRTNALRGRQQLSAIRGDVEADGVAGDLELIQVDGQVLVARVVDGHITARDLRTPVVRLLSTAGGVVLIGSLRTGGRYELTALEGDVKLRLTPGPFSLEAHAPRGRVISAFAVAGAPSPIHLQGDHAGGGPSLALSAERGDVVIEPR